ncbi:MAG TPA: phytanoyl-CoA dioxygenase family protein [Pirellulales bacterium]|nr:phytanoyl-CoA dioxygenase family protein [Pirellulales bacterium]
MIEIEPDGFSIVPHVIDGRQADLLIAAVDKHHPGRAAAYGRRDLLSVPEVVELATSKGIRALVVPVLGKAAFAVRGLWFDKLPLANWKVAWHQDLTIAVRQRVDVAGFQAWSVKDGVPHVQPPAEVLERMLAVRIHLDDCGQRDGPLRVIPRSHGSGRLSAAAIEQWKQTGQERACCVPQGGALLMRPLLLHSSSAADHPGHRRVIHLEFASGELPGGLEWHTRLL